jgi:hypothetical protein
MFTLFDRSTGQVLGSFNHRKSADLNAVDGRGLIEGDYDAGRFWIEDGEPPVARERKPMVLAVDGRSIAGLPKGATINGVPASSWVAPDDEVAPRVLIEAPRHIPQALVLKDYRALRAEAYPPAGEQLGAYAKALQALLEGKEPPADALAVLAKIDAVKAAHPKT